MEEFSGNFLTVLSSMAAGAVLFWILERLKRKNPKAEENKKENAEEKDIDFCGEREKDPMELRNGFGVTRDKNPTFAEQWVNIMNYCGESQTEDGYEEENDYPAGYME